jgi:lipopolysaccharide/colanic/teichoic acid biosynthesis glycosyltransferase
MSTIPRTNGSPTSAATEEFVSLSEHSNAEILPQEFFLRMLDLERKRSERSRRRFVLMLLESGSLLTTSDNAKSLERVVGALSNSTRETDIKGWYREGAVVGIIFTEIGTADGKSVASALLNKVTNALCSTLSIEQINEIKLTFHVFPEDSNKHGLGSNGDSLLRDLDAKRGARFAKRSLDILGSLFALALFSPVLLLIAALVRLSSTGPVFFRQVRIGRHGNRFTFLKFRSMYLGNDHTIHQDYVKRLIAGTVGSDPANGNSNGVYKLTNDPRVTPIGRILRRTSLDELPQFLNVLMGEMSLVGPRPPIPYEFECYDFWHKRRLLSVKPGITGLWQVGGRSSVKFDDMVRLDLKYARTWSVWLDIKILLQTPGAVISGDGAY